MTVTDFQHTWAGKINKSILCFLDSSGQHKMLTQIAKSTKAAIHLGKLESLVVTGFYFVQQSSISAR